MATPSKGLRAYLEAAKEPDSLFGDIQKHVMHKAAQPSGRALDCIHPSETVKPDWCIRANYFRIMTNVAHNPRQVTFRLENIFAEGNNTHSKWQRWLAEMGKLEGDWKCSVCTDIFYANSPEECPNFCPGATFVYEELRLEHKPLMIAGRTDGYVPDENCLVEIKTMSYGGLKWELPEFVADYEKYMNSKTWVALENLWREFRRPLPTAVKQGQLYLWLARRQGLDVNRILFIYDFKANQDVKSFMLNYDPTLISEIIEKCEQITEAVKAQTPPPCSNNPAKLCAQCRPYETEEA